jgi:hypothetical protein
MYCLFKPLLKGEGVAKASVNSAFCIAELQYVADPKPGDLSMSRVNSVEERREARTGVSCNLLG